MYKFRVAVKKEFLILLSDKTGLALMFLMPLLLVYIITIIQDSAFKMANQSSMALLVINQDEGEQSQHLIRLLEQSQLFELTQDSTIAKDAISTTLYEQEYLTAVYFPPNFSEQLKQKANLLSGTLLAEVGMNEGSPALQTIATPTLEYYHDPVLQESYSISIMNMIDAYIKTVEGELLINEMCQQLELTEAPAKLREAMANNQVGVKKIAATLNSKSLQPNSTQHNVPAWTIFAMFFMVTSLGNSIVKERLNGSFVRLKTMPTSFVLVLGAKLFVYLVAAVLQVLLIFTLARFTFESIGLPPLTFPSDGFAFAVVVLMNGLAAVSYATVVGTVARTREQASGFGAVSIVILAALGGIWIPSFVLPEFLQLISYGSPLYWCLEGFYTLFLRGGDWQILLPTLAGLAVFIVACWAITYWQLKRDKVF